MFLVQVFSLCANETILYIRSRGPTFIVVGPERQNSQDRPCCHYVILTERWTGCANACNL